MNQSESIRLFRFLYLKKNHTKHSGVAMLHNIPNNVINSINKQQQQLLRSLVATQLKIYKTLIRSVITGGETCTYTKKKQED